MRLLALLLALAACGSRDGVVGGQCADGYVQRGHSCVAADGGIDAGDAD